MNKTELIAATYDKAHVSTGVSRNQVDGVLNAALEVILEELASGSAVNITGFGKFAVKATAARTGRNPKTGEPITIPAGKKVVFKVGAELKAQVNS